MRVKYPSAVRWGKANATRHAAFFCMWLQYDHVVPNSRGGETDEVNVVITCAACNFGRMERTLEEVGKEFGVTRERIRQIESKTLSKLRHPSRSQKLRDYLE